MASQKEIKVLEKEIAQLKQDVANAGSNAAAESLNATITKKELQLEEMEIQYESESERVRCDHCGKWQLHGDMVMPHTSEKYWDGAFAVCPKCANNKAAKYTTAYWDKWYEDKREHYANLKAQKELKIKR